MYALFHAPVAPLMDIVPGNVYYSDLSFMDPTDPIYISLLASASTHTLWPVTPVDHVPGHLVPGSSFVAHHR